MKQGRAWKANSSWTSLESLHTLWNMTFHYHFHNSAIFVIKQSHFNPIPTSHSVYKVCFNGIFPPTSVSSKMSLSVRFPHSSVLLPAEKRHPLSLSNALTLTTSKLSIVQTLDWETWERNTSKLAHRKLNTFYLEAHNLIAGSQRVQLCSKSVVPEHE